MVGNGVAELSRPATGWCAALVVGVPLKKPSNMTKTCVFLNMFILDFFL